MVLQHISILDTFGTLPIISGVRSFFGSSRVLRVNLDHMLIWSVNWSEVAAGNYAIVDPEDSESILYVSKKEYLRLIGQIESSERRLVLLATPFSTKPLDRDIKASRPGSEKTPPRFREALASDWKVMQSSIRKAFMCHVDRRSGMFKVSKTNLRPLVRRWSELLAHWLCFPQTALGWYTAVLSVCPKLITILRTRGPRGLVAFLKTSMLIIQQFISGKRCKSWDFGYPVSLRAGLPAWIPCEGRSAIRQGSVRVIRFWLSICYLYKIIQVPYQVHSLVKTITAPALVLTSPVQSLLDEYREFLHLHFIPRILGTTRRGPQAKSMDFTPTSAGPNGAPAIEYVPEDFRAWDVELQKMSPLWKALEYLWGRFGFQRLCNLHIHMGQYCPGDPSEMTPEYEKTLIGPSRRVQKSKTAKKIAAKQPILSRVYFLAEPAGKIRPVAIIDAISQRVLKTLHDDLFVVLKGIVEDGTHNQERLFTRLQKFMSLRSGFWSSLDISSATDMIPVQFYRILLEELYNRTGPAVKLADSVITLLTDREFTLSSDGKSIPIPDDLKDKKVRYGRGQPMGALSSFALLGLWHHSFIHFAAHKCGCRWVTYGVTGDDAVICEADPSHPIANMYLELCKIVGIPISLPKSFLSGTLFNFLSRTSSKVVGEVSPASAREEFAIRDSAGRTSRALRLANRGWCAVSDTSGRLMKAMRLFLDGHEWTELTEAVRKGTVSDKASRGILSLLAPSSKVSWIGLQTTAVFGWLATFVGSTAVLCADDMLRQDKLVVPSKLRYDEPLILRELLQLVLEEIISKLIENRARLDHYNGWIAKQSVTLWGSGRGLWTNKDGVDTKHCLWVDKYGDGLPIPEWQELAIQILGTAWYEDQNLRASVDKAWKYLARIRELPDYRNPYLFRDEWAKKMASRGTQELSRFERRAQSLMLKLLLRLGLEPRVAWMDLDRLFLKEFGKTA